MWLLFMESKMNIQASLVFASAILLLLFRETSPQFFPEKPEGVSGETFYLDKPSNCQSRDSYSVTGKTIIVGRSFDSGSTIPKECTITLESYGQKPMKFELEISKLKLDHDMTFYIYDGGSTGSILKSYDVHRGNDNAFDPVYTTGSKVSFRLVRNIIDSNANYDIRIIAQAVEAIIIGGGGSNHHLDRAEQRDRKFDTDIIIILMCTAFIFAFLIYGGVLIAYWKRRNATTEKWTERPIGYDNAGLAQTNSTLAYVEQVKTHPPDNPRVQSPADFNKMNGRQPQNYQTRMARSSVDADSVFEEKTRRRNESNNGRLQSETYSNQAYQHTPVRSRGRLSQRNARSSHRNKESISPTSSDVPSVRQENQKWQPKPKKQVIPEPNQSESEEEEEEVEQASIGMNTDPEMTDHGVQCDASSEPEGPPSKPSTTVTSVGVGSSPVLSSRRNSPGPRRYHRPPSYEEALSDVDYPSVSPNQPRRSPQPKQSRVPYVHYSNPTLRHPQPVYSQNPQQHPDYSHPTHLPKTGNENNIPIYSYLVNRGYNIDDGQSSGDATSHRSDSRLGHTDDSDVTANLDCGIELMRR